MGDGKILKFSCEENMKRALKLRAQLLLSLASLFIVGLAFAQKDGGSWLKLIDEAVCLGVRKDLAQTWKMRVYFTSGDNDSALIVSQQLLMDDPSLPEAWRIQALASAAKRQFPDALAAAKQWARIEPENPEPNRLAAAVCRDMGDLEQGLDLTRQAYRLEPENYEIIFEYAAFLDAMDQVAQAEVLMRKILDQFPDDAQALNFLGYMWASRGRKLDEAETMISSAIKQEPDQPAYLDSMGWLWYQRGNLEKAAKWLEEAIEKGGRNPEIYRHFAQVNIELGKHGSAKEVLEQGLKWNPGDRSLLEFLIALDDD